MYFFALSAACLCASSYAQIPGYPSYTLTTTNTTLGLQYGDVKVRPGELLGYKVPSHVPKLTTPLPLNNTYIALLVDTTTNLTSPIPASLLWFQQNVTFTPSPSPSGTSTLVATFNPSSAQVPYLAPSNPGHAYVALLYTQPPGFAIPPDFPYDDGFRGGFNVSRVGVDFRTPLLEASWFVLGDGCVGGYAGAMGTGSGIVSGDGWRASRTETGWKGHEATEYHSRPGVHASFGDRA